MAEFTMTIAGRTALVRPMFESTEYYCGAYLTREEPDFSVCVTAEDLIFEQAALDQEAREEGFRYRKFTDPFLERAAICRAFAEDLFDHGTLMLHGSAVALENEAFLFTAPSGTGKSTHTRLWCQVFGNGARMINDDKPFLQCGAEAVLACGSPWSGKHGLDSNCSVPLRGICLLERGTENRIWSISPEEALPMLLKQGYCPLDPAKAEEYRTRIRALAEQVPLWRMACTKDPAAARLAKAIMSGDGGCGRSFL